MFADPCFNVARCHSLRDLFCRKNSYLSEVCCLGVACGMALVGPASILRHLFNWSKQHLWLVYVAAACNGMFFGGALMPTFNDMLTAAELVF